MKRNTWIALAVGVVVVGGVSFTCLRKPSDEIKWRTAKVDRSNITQKISATGSINALVQVPVGTQVSGVVTGLYADFNSLVKKGQVIARIDSTVWETQLRDAEAGLQRAQASYDNAKAEFNRNKRLAEANLISASDLEARELSLKSTESGLQSAKASVQRARINLGYCTITAPVDGVVVSRVVDEGQTVAASFSTPNLFTIAQDLARLKVQAAIDEADIGQVQVGQKAFFTVDSYPDRQFQGQVTEVQLNPITTNNVVTYNVIMQVENQAKNLAEAAVRGPRPGAPPEGGRPRGPRPGSTGGEPVPERARPATLKLADHTATIEVNTARYIPAGSKIYKGDLALFPGMTANVTIITRQQDNVLRVPNAALRFNPAAFQKADTKSGVPPQGGMRPGGNAAGGNKGGLVSERKDKVWTLENGKVKELPAKAGITDGQFTEVSGESIAEDIEVLVGVQDTKKAADNNVLPVLGTPGPQRRH
jgi:RND family efflux transporter MFP subunit